MKDITQQSPYPFIKSKKNGRRQTVTKEENRRITKWCRNPQRVKEVIRRFHIWSIQHQWCADNETREWVKEDIEKIKKDLGI